MVMISQNKSRIVLQVGTCIFLSRGVPIKRTKRLYTVVNEPKCVISKFFCFYLNLLLCEAYLCILRCAFK